VRVIGARIENIFYPQNNFEMLKITLQKSEAETVST
jgi:hypothetical protein